RDAGDDESLPVGGRQLLIGALRHACRDVRTKLATVTIGAVAAGATRYEYLAPGILCLRRRGRSRQQNTSHNARKPHESPLTFSRWDSVANEPRNQAVRKIREERRGAGRQIRVANGVLW